MTTKGTVGSQLKRAREAKKYTLREVEEITGISNAYLSQLENNKISNPSAQILYKLSDLLSIPFELLMVAYGVIDEKDMSEKMGFTRGKRPKTLEGHSLFSSDLTEDEERELTKYLKFLRFGGAKRKL